MAGVPYVFGNVTTSIPLSNLDADFNTPVTIGTSTVGLGNTTTSLVGLSNVSTTIVGSTGNLTIQSGSTTAITVDTSQNVGIGTSSPQFKLDLTYGDVTGPAMVISGGRTAGGVPEILFKNSYWVSGNVGAASIAAGDNGFAGGFIAFKTTTSGSGTSGVPSEQMRIDSSGNVLVGLTATGASPAVGYILNSNGFLQIARASGAAQSTVGFYNGGTIVGQIVTSTVATSYLTTSDYRLKTVISPVTDAGTRLDAIQPIEYEWNNGIRSKGFLAHQFAEVYPNSVSGEKDAVDVEGKPVYQGMQASTSEVMADLIAEIQSLRKRVATLEAK